MSEKRHIAVIGCGYWGKNLVRNFYQLDALHTVCEVSEDGQATAKTIAPDAHLVNCIEDVLNEPSIKGVAISAPAELHHSLSMQCLEAGKDVLVEKPLALDYREGLEIQKLANSKKAVLMVGHLLEYHPVVLKLRELISHGELGQVNYIYSNRLNFGKIRTEENALWSFAPHDISVILRLFNEMPIEVTCCGGNYVTPHLADVTVSCLHFPSGRRAHIFVSWLNPFKEQKLVVVGDQKMAVFNDINPTDKLVVYNQRVDFDAAHKPVLEKGNSEPIDYPKDEPLKQECKHFLECMATRNTPLTDANNGIRVLKVLQALQVSLQLNGRPAFLDAI